LRIMPRAVANKLKLSSKSKFSHNGSINYVSIYTWK
jgi:hypothetical protein